MKAKNSKTKLGDAMKEAIAGALGLPLARVGIKATTNERLGFIGREEGIAAMAVAMLDSH